MTDDKRTSDVTATGDSFARREVSLGVYQCGCRWEKTEHGDVMRQCAIHDAATKASVAKFDREHPEASAGLPSNDAPSDFATRHIMCSQGPHPKTGVRTIYKHASDCKHPEQNEEPEAERGPRIPIQDTARDMWLLVTSPHGEVKVPAERYEELRTLANKLANRAASRVDNPNATEAPYTLLWEGMVGTGATRRTIHRRGALAGFTVKLDDGKWAVLTGKIQHTYYEPEPEVRWEAIPTSKEQWLLQSDYTMYAGVEEPGTGLDADAARAVVGAVRTDYPHATPEALCDWCNPTLGFALNHAEAVAIIDFVRMRDT